MSDLLDDEADRASIKTWLDSWCSCVVSVDFASARLLFDENIVSFGTWMDVVEGLDKLTDMQWKIIWPTIKDFRFLIDTLQVRVSSDRLFAIAVLAWNSTGFHENGESFQRPGRASIGLRRANLGAPWRGNHTHLSLNRGVPQISHGAPV